MLSLLGAQWRALLLPVLVCASTSATTLLAPTVALGAPAGTLEDVVVTAILRPEPTLAVAASVTVLDTKALHVGGEQHFEDVLAQVPNLNYAGGTNRARYFQVRGIGELDQYEGAPNPSVGLLVDDIDFSGLGSMATLFDIDRVEVLRGPQGTRYGANALAGLLYLSSAEPRDTFGARLEASAGDYGTRSLGAVLTGPVSALDSSFRLAAQRYTSNGTIQNDFLHRNDTNGRDETTVRGRWHWIASPSTQIDLAILHVGIDDGYDAFSPENSRVTHSDKPGIDQQRSTGVSARTTWTGDDERTVTTIGTWAESKIVYGYDGDWGNPTYWAPYTYDFTEVQHRQRKTGSAEVRYASAPTAPLRWLVGVYGFDLREALNDLNRGISVDPVNGEYDLSTVLDSGYHVRSVSVYSVVDADLSAHTRWSLGLRGEHRTSNYSDFLIDQVYTTTDAHTFAPSEGLVGGHVSLTHDWDPRQSVYLQLSRGYKASGFNLSQGLTPSEITFRAEADWNAEAGYKSRSERLDVDTDVFIVSRKQAQLRSSVQTDPMNPNSFIFYTGNATSGLDYGAELTVRAQLSSHLNFGTSVAVLHTWFHNSVRIGDSGLISVARELPHAPHASGSAHLEYRASAGFYGRIDISAMSGFFYDLPPNETRSGGYGLAHLRVGYDAPRWSASLYVRNLANKTYTTRGFYFGLEPPDYPNKLYVQLGEPRVYGIDFTARVGSLAGR